MKIIRTGWLALLAAVPLAAAHLSLAQEPLGLSPVQRPFQSAEGATIPAGKRFTFVCPASDGANATVYGTDVYTADSAVCAAAIHAGVLRLGQAGAVTVVMGSGAASFPASSRNGITTRSYGPWDRSYTFARDGAPGTITWRTIWSGVPDDFVASITVECPPTRTAAGKLWGTDVYTRDSVVCLAAVHSGAIAAENGGLVVVTRARHATEFAASTRNGIASASYGPFADAFSVAAAVRAAGGAASAGAAAGSGAAGAAAQAGGSAAPASGGAGSAATGAAAAGAAGSAAGASATGAAAQAGGSAAPASSGAGSAATGAAAAGAAGSAAGASAAGAAAQAGGSAAPASSGAGSAATGAAAAGAAGSAAGASAAGAAAQAGGNAAPASGGAGSAATGAAAGGAGSAAGGGAASSAGASQQRAGSTSEKPPPSR